MVSFVIYASICAHCKLTHQNYGLLYSHLGFSLDRNSVPLCVGAEESVLQDCFLSQRKRFIWENRDFNVDIEPMLQYIEQFVLFNRDKERQCDELKDRLDKKFVMYNVWCNKPNKWHPTMLLDGTKVCGYGSDYPVDNTDLVASKMFLFDTKDDCCDMYPGVCENESKAIEQQQQNATHQKHVWHQYQKLNTQQMLDQVQKPIINKNRRRRKQQIEITINE